LNATKEIRVANADSVEFPRQVYNVSTYESGYVASVNVVWQANVSALSTVDYFIYWGNPDAAEPTYATDVSVSKTDTNLTVWNPHYRVNFVKKDPSWYGIPDTVNYLYYNPYNPTENLGRADWSMMLMTVINIDPYWHLPFMGKPIHGTNVTIKEQGPVFIEVEAVYGDWTIAGVNSLVKTFRFYAHVPWFTLTSDFNLTGATYQHIQTESYISKTAFLLLTYRKTDGSLKSFGFSPSQGDFHDWDGTWIDAENVNTTDNTVGMAFIAMPGTTPPFKAFRSDQNSIAPFQNGTLLSARQNLAILLHQGNYIVAEQLYNQTQQLLLPTPGLGPVTSMTVLATIIDKVSGVASPDIKVEVFFRDNGTLYEYTETNELGTAIFRDIPSGNYTVTSQGVSRNVTVTNEKAYWAVRIRVMVPRPFLLYVVVGVGICIGIFAVTSVIKRRK